jgi:hypothetical protein
VIEAILWLVFLIGPFIALSWGMTRNKGEEWYP